MLRPYLQLSRTVHVLCVGALVNRAGAFLVPFLTLYLRKELDLTVGFATTGMAVFGAGALVASLIGGHLADRIGRKAVMLISLFGGAAVLIFFGFLSQPWMILTAILVFSLLSEMYRPAALAMLADVTDSEQRAHAFGLMYVAINLGFAVAAVVGGVLAEVSFQWLFWGDALSAGAFALLILFVIKESLPKRDDRNALEHTAAAVETMDSALRSEPDRDGASLGDAVRHILSNGVFLVFCGATFVLAVMYMQSFVTFPIFLNDLGFSPRTYGLIIALNGILIVFFQLPLTSLVIRYHRGWMITLSAVITGVGFAAFGIASAPWHFAIAVAVWTTGEMIGSPLSSAIVSDLAPQRFRARYMGVFTMSFSSSMMVGAPLGGLVLQRLGGGWLWGLCGMLGLAAALAFGVLRHGLLSPARKQETDATGGSLRRASPPPRSSP